MVKYLYKKSYQLKSLEPTKYNDLWGTKGVFTTIRVVSKKHKKILFKDHIKKINLSLKKYKINFKISEKIILELLKPAFKKIKLRDTLLRIAVNNNLISVSLRVRSKPYKNFIARFYSYARSDPQLKNLYYKKILKLLNYIDPKKEEIILYKNGLILEGCTTNIICIHNRKLYLPIKNYYMGITINYLLKKTKRKIIKTNISINNLDYFDEILLVGSGKGVIKLNEIPEINWKSQSDLVYKELLNIYKKNF